MIKPCFLLLLFCCVSSSAKHSLKYLLTSPAGISNLPEFMGLLMVDDIEVCYCDSNKRLEVKQDAWKKILDENQLWKLITQQCFEILPELYKARRDRIKELYNQTDGVHILQVIRGCELDETTGAITGLMKCGYDGEDLMSLDLKSQTWVALKPQAVTIKQEWDADKASNQERVEFITQTYPKWLKTYLSYENNSLLRTDLPSVSLLQKTPSSPVSCHATGFYPDRADMFWRKDGKEIHEGVEHGEILPNHDGTFQMSIDVNISSVKPEDWSRYDCVFQFSGAENITITKLDKAKIKSNRVPPSAFPVAVVIGVVVGLLLLLCCCLRFCLWFRRYIAFMPANTSGP
ncbi:major histocompatibility complex class I-related gene protein-like [Anabas testudineus]|uniref:Ig-like domain-containing protein n=1 Tax=Anabas testudineus TaxID=64144 RepID=A0A3Q1IYV8_ANATE|nr:major histocompatibility complex class I-related gene protein-like [Anabas testudineus]XP_026204526.1 major histocompatibility complex class I-related gene protein-like [Anabas testudineus]